MEGRAATLFPELPEQSPETLVPKKVPFIERVSKLSSTIARYVNLKQRFDPFDEDDPLDLEVLKKKAEDLQVVRHEMGHVVVAEDSGASDISATVIRGPNYRGLTRAFLNKFSSVKDLWHARIRIALGGHVGEERDDQTDHSGTGSDMGTVEAYAEALSTRIYKGAYSVASIISDEFRNARRMVFSCQDWDQRSLHFTEQQSI